jgi:hypothetical protein
VQRQLLVEHLHTDAGQRIAQARWSRRFAASEADNNFISYRGCAIVCGCFKLSDASYCG